MYNICISNLFWCVIVNQKWEGSTYVFDLIKVK